VAQGFMARRTSHKVSRGCLLPWGESVPGDYKEDVATFALNMSQQFGLLLPGSDAVAVSASAARRTDFLSGPFDPSSAHHVAVR